MNYRFKYAVLEILFFVLDLLIDDSVSKGLVSDLYACMKSKMF